MASAVLLLTYAVAMGTLGAALLRDARWPMHSPRLALVAWQTLSLSVLFATAAAGLALAVSLPHVRDDLSRLFDLCAESLRIGYAPQGGGLAAVVGASLFSGIAVRTAWCAYRVFVGNRRQRAHQLAAVDLVADRSRVPGACVLDHPVPYAFSMGGRRHRVVLTTGLLSALNGQQLRAVVAHERAHVSQHHHRSLLICQALFRTLAPAFPAFRGSPSLVRLYAELAADDAARKDVGALSLRQALAELACQPAPAGTLAATGADVAARLHRLEREVRPMASASRLGAGLSLAVIVLVPLALVAAPALTMLWEGVCFVG